MVSDNLTRGRDIYLQYVHIFSNTEARQHADSERRGLSSKRLFCKKVPY